MAIWHVALLRFAPAFRALGVCEHIWPFSLRDIWATPGRPSMDILVRFSKMLARSCQDLGKILAKILPRYWQELQDVMVRSYQESHVPKKIFCKIPFEKKKI